MRVMSGRERSLSRLLARVIPHEVLSECFSPQYATQIKMRGNWVPCKKTLFPGYLIAATDDVEALRRHLRDVPEFTRVLTMGDVFTPLTDEEVAWITAFTREGDRVVPMSMGVIEEMEGGDRIVVTSGPLVGHEAMIKSVNRRKSTATIEIEMFGRKTTARVGLGIVAKRRKG